MIREVIEAGFTLSLFANAILFLPQIIRILREKTSKGVSLITFSGFWLIQLLTVMHGFLRKDYLLAYGTIFSMVMSGIVVALILSYRDKELISNHS